MATFSYNRENSAIVRYVVEDDPDLYMLSIQFRRAFEDSGGRGLGVTGAAVCLHALGVFLNENIPAGPAVTRPDDSAAVD